MRTLLTGLTVAALATTACLAADKPKGDAPVAKPLEHKVKGIDGNDLDLSQYKGKVVLFVNVASKCGYTPQYAGLQALYERYAKDGLVVIGVPANEFGGQEPDPETEIQKFCTTRYKVTFPMTAKQVVKGNGQSALYATLTDGDKKPIVWNFEKFLINRKGEVVARFESGVEPNGKELVGAIEKELDAK
jgi:glutathione peroxidase